MRRLLLVLLLVPCVAQGARLFDSTGLIVAKPDNTQGATLADLDRDGLADMVTGLSSGVGVARALGGGLFAPDVVSFADRGAIVFAGLADVDGDGLLDLPARSASGVLVLFGDGNCGFGGSFELALPNLGFGAIAAGDLDGDGRADLAYGTTDSSVVVLHANADRTLTVVQTIPAHGFLSIGGVITNVVGSSARDLVVGSGSGVSIFEGVGDGTLGTRTDIVLGGARSSVSVGQVDGAFGPDIVVGAPGITWIPSTGAGTFGAPISVPAPYLIGLSEARDFDGNGTIDIGAAVRNPFRGIAFWPGDGAGGFGAAVESPMSIFDPSSLSFGDVDGDGRIDVATRGSFTFNIVVGRGHPGGRFGEPQSVPRISGRLGSVAVGDFDRDGHLDAVCGETNVGRLAFARGHGNGTFDPLVLAPVTGATYSRLVAGLFDGDAFLDLVATSNSAVSFLRGHGDGTFDPAVDFALPGIPRGLVAADVDADGDLDAAIPVPTSNAIYVLQQGTTLVSTPSLAGAISVAYADLNGDARPDRVVGGTDQWRVELADGLGGYVPLAAHAQTPTPGDVALADLDEDGRLDVLIAQGASTGGVPYPALVHAWHGLPGGAFDSESIVDLDWVVEPTANHEGVAVLFAQDFDGDGHLDLVARSSSNASLCTVARGHGDRTFGEAEAYAQPFSTAGLAPGDFDEDGHLDLLGCGATGTPATTSLTFLRNISAGVVAVSPPVRTVSFAITRLAPNPSRGAFALELAAPGRGEARLSVVSLAGRVLQERTVALTPGSNRVALENGLKAGVYWVRAEGFGKATAQKFVVLP